MEQQETATRRLLGIKYEPNIEGRELSEIMGFDYPDIPLKAQLTLRNRLFAYCHANRVNSPDLTWAALSSRFLGLDFLGIYIPQVHTYIVREDSKPVAYHENFHGYVHLRNPRIRQVAIEGLAASFGSILGNPDSGDLIQKAMMTKILDEGICQYVGIKAAYSRGDQHSRESAIRLNNQTLALSDTTDKGRMDHDMLKALIGHMHEVEVGLYEKKTGLKALKQFNDLDKLSPLFYTLGLKFCIDAIKFLQEQGLTEVEAVNLLIDNPPSKIKHLDDPSEFIKANLS